MNSKRFLMGVGLGMVAGSALGMVAAPKRRNDSKRMVSRALKGMGNVIDDVTTLMGK